MALQNSCVCSGVNNVIFIICTVITHTHTPVKSSAGCHCARLTDITTLTAHVCCCYLNHFTELFDPFFQYLFAHECNDYHKPTFATPCLPLGRTEQRDSRLQLLGSPGSSFQRFLFHLEALVVPLQMCKLINSPLCHQGCKLFNCLLITSWMVLLIFRPEEVAFVIFRISICLI